ncbi:MAG: aminotransferase class IV [Phascolarctobacterium sp.]|nr:aminotransferase class IV [Phascolarctobacterium sp.]
MENKENLVMINGEFYSPEEATISVNNRGFNFGDGIFELVPVYNGRCFGLLQHMNNFFNSAIALKLPGIYMVDELVIFHEALLKETGLKDCEIYSQLTRGDGAYGLGHPEANIPELVMFAVPVDREALKEKRAQGVGLVTEVDERWAKCNINTLNRLPEVMAKQKAVVGKYYDALFVRDGKITESTESSFFIYKDGILWTHPENNFIHTNVTRQLLMERLSKDMNIPVMEKTFDKAFALKAEEAFLCGPRCEFMPVVKIDRTPINEGKLGPVVMELQKRYEDFVTLQCK